MATTKSMQCRFVIKEGADITHEPRDGRIELWDAVFLVAEPVDTKTGRERPLSGPDYLSFPLNPVGNSPA